jgi:hypothetical protein
MTDLAPVLVKCVICRHPLVAAINKRIRDNGVVPTVRWCDENDIFPERTPHRNTFNTHKQEHMTSDHERQLAHATDAMRKQQETIKVKGKAGDLAALVRDNVFARVEEGLLEPSLTEGLRAQEMLDRRSEKGADRDMMIALAGLLSGASMPVALLGDGSTIEGSFREVSPERTEDEESFTALLTAG